MSLTINLLIIIATFLFMECVAWFTHKYVMHGMLWSWHRSHHTVHHHALEMNDLFALVFSFCSIATIYIGVNYEHLSFFLYIGIGIFCYGLFYFIFHDIIVHRRIKTGYKPKSGYMKRIIHAHYIHHEKHTKHEGSAFGFLYAPKRYSPTHDRHIKAFNDAVK